MYSFVYCMDVEWWHVGIYIYMCIASARHETPSACEVALLIFSLIYLAVIGRVVKSGNTRTHIKYRPGDGIIAWITYCLSMCVHACVFVVRCALFCHILSAYPFFALSRTLFINAIFHYVVCACLFQHRTQKCTPIFRHRRAFKQFIFTW